MSQELVDPAKVYGRGELRQYRQIEGGDLVLYSYFEFFARDGEKRGQTEPREIARVALDCVLPVTAEDFAKWAQ